MHRDVDRVVEAPLPAQPLRLLIIPWPDRHTSDHVHFAETLIAPGTSGVIHERMVGGERGEFLHVDGFLDWDSFGGSTHHES
jgi:hypothetical protein